MLSRVSQTKPDHLLRTSDLKLKFKSTRNELGCVALNIYKIYKNYKNKIYIKLYVFDNFTNFQNFNNFIFLDFSYFPLFGVTGSCVYLCTHFHYDIVDSLFMLRFVHANARPLCFLSSGARCVRSVARPHPRKLRISGTIQERNEMTRMNAFRIVKYAHVLIRYSASRIK